MKISVCVPAYERPATLKKLVASFLSQDYEQKELCVSDDSLTSQISDLIADLGAPDILYKRNASALGYHRNLRSALEMASGDILVVLGDDDVFARRSALSEYAEAFASFPFAHFAYGNLLQIDEADRLTLSYRFFDETTEYRAGAPALTSLMLRSVLITGMAFKNSRLLADLYPADEMLFPQVSLVASLLTQHSGVGIASYLCAARAWGEQLGFKENDKPASVAGPRHGNVEVVELIRSLKDLEAGNRSVIAALERQLIGAYASNLINERIANGNSVVRRNVGALFVGCPRARLSVRLWAALAISHAMTPRMANAVKTMLRRVVAHWRLRDGASVGSELAKTVADVRR